jgi:hypothetical protein
MQTGSGSHPGVLEERLEELRQQYPEPFAVPSGLDQLCTLPPAREILAGGRAAAEELLHYVDRSSRPDLVRIAIILLSQLGEHDVYPALLRRVAEADEAGVAAFEPGLWLLPIPEPRIVADIARVVDESGNPSALLLLQRPSAASVKPVLRRFVERRELPLSRYALYAFDYMLETEDAELLKSVARGEDAPPDMRGLAGLYLLQLGSPAGVDGLRAALTARDEGVRVRVYSELARTLPAALLSEAGFEPTGPPDSQTRALDRLLEKVFD